MMTLDGNQIRRELDDKGVCVVPGVISERECDDLADDYKQWLKQFKQDDWPSHMYSVIQQYNVGHFRETWIARLKTKAVFQKVWQTEKLLTSFDGVALSPPPELGGFAFAVEDSHWFHLDQGATRKGLHAYQGAVYLEETTDTDYVFRVLEGSHKFHNEFFRTFHRAAKISSEDDFYKLTPDEFDWYTSMGCVRRVIPVPKGGMVLWDSRTIHDNNRPQQGRTHAERWRIVVFSCMTPAIWAKPNDIENRRTAYKRMLMTTHWPSQKVSYFDDYLPTHASVIKTITELPDVAKTDEVKQLAGVLDYNMEDGISNGPEEPKWLTLEEMGLATEAEHVDNDTTDGSVPAWKKQNKYYK